MYIMHARIIMFVQRFEQRHRRFKNFHYHFKSFIDHSFAFTFRLYVSKVSSPRISHKLKRVRQEIIFMCYLFHLFVLNVTASADMSKKGFHFVCII